MGPRTVSCGTLDVTSHGVEYPSITTRCNRLDKKDFIHCNGFPLIPYYSNFCASLVCGTLSKAFDRSNIPKSTRSLLFRAQAKSLMVINNCDSQECPDLIST